MKETNTYLKYINVPVELLYNDELSLADLKVFAMVDICDGPKHCFASNQFIGTNLKLNEATVSRSISKLIKLNYVKLVRKQTHKASRIISIDQNYKDLYQNLIMDQYKCVDDFRNRYDEKYKVNDEMVKGSMTKWSSTDDEMVKRNTIDNNIVEELSKDNTSVSDETPDETPSYPPGKRVNLPIQQESPISSKRKEIPVPKVTQDISEIISIWNNCGATTHKLPQEGKSPTKAYASMVKTIRSLLRGTFFNGNSLFPEYHARIFSKKEIIHAIMNFSLAATNGSYQPYENSKAYLRKLSFAGFIYNDHGRKVNKYDYSKFILYFEKEPELIKTPATKLTDKFPMHKNALAYLYSKEILGINTETPDLTEYDDQCFVKASILLNEFFVKHGRNYDMSRFNSPYTQAEALFEAIKTTVFGDRILKPMNFTYESLFKTTFPAFLNKGEDNSIL